MLATLGLSAACGSDPAPDLPNARQLISLSSLSTWESEAWLAASPEGRVLVAAWTGRDTVGDWSLGGPIGYTFSSDGGATWKPPAAMAFPDRETPFNVKVAADARGDFWAVWLARSMLGPKDAIVVARSRPDALSFEAPIEVTSPTSTGDYDLPAIVSHRGAVLAAYTVFHESCMATEVARSMDGLTWTRATAGPCEPATPVRNLNAICASETSDRVWLANAAGDPDGDSASPLRVELRHSDDHGLTWPASSLQIISAPGQRVAFDPIVCTMQGDDLWIAYGLTDGAIQPGLFAKLTSIQVVRVAPAGTVTRFEVPNPSGAFAMHPQITSDATGTVHVLSHVGARDDDPAGALRSTHLPQGASQFEAGRSLDGPMRFNEQWGEEGFLGDYYGVATAGGSIMAAYGFGAGTDIHIAFQKWSAMP